MQMYGIYSTPFSTYAKLKHRYKREITFQERICAQWETSDEMIKILDFFALWNKVVTQSALAFIKKYCYQISCKEPNAFLHPEVRSPGNIHNLWDEVDTETAPGHSLDLKAEETTMMSLQKNHDPLLSMRENWVRKYFKMSDKEVLRYRVKCFVKSFISIDK